MSASKATPTTPTTVDLCALMLRQTGDELYWRYKLLELLIKHYQSMNQCGWKFLAKRGMKKIQKWKALKKNGKNENGNRVVCESWKKWRCSQLDVQGLWKTPREWLLWWMDSRQDRTRQDLCGNQRWRFVSLTSQKPRNGKSSGKTVKKNI